MDETDQLKKFSKSIKLTILGSILLNNQIMIYLILAHNSPEILSLLLKKLSKKGVYFVIHIDKNHNINPFLEASLGIPNCHFLAERFASHWGSFALVEATLQALQYIRKTLKKRKRVVLLSGSDYPIKDNTYIKRFLDSHPNTIFIEYEAVPRKVWHMGGINRFPFYNNVKEDIKFFGGSQWFSIPYRVISIIFKFLERSPDFLSYFRLVKIADESFFQTLLLNCDHSFVKQNLRNQHLHHLKWDKPYNHPRTMTIKDLTQLMKSKSLFARKFDIVTSQELLEKLELNNRTLTSVNSQAILYLTDNIDRYKGRFQKLKEETKDGNIYCITTDRKNRKLGSNHIFYEHNYSNHMGFKPFDNNKIIPGSTFFALLYFFRINDQYDYYWLIEDDVWYNGNWSNFFDRFKNINADFISCYNTNYTDAKHWYWWDTINDTSIANEYKIRTFYPVARFSNSALSFLNKELKSGISGHGEVLLPTLLSMNGFSLNDLSMMENSSHNPATLILPCSQRAISANNDGTYRYRPLINRDEIKEEYLYHPVKHDIIS